MKKPLLLAPAGSYDALVSAINAGADEVYFGAKGFNARYGAKNFENAEFEEALKLCRLYGVRSNITVNTLVTDRELNEALDLVYNAASLGADCFIVQDLGLAREIKAQMPSLELHASTQCACHSLEGAKKLAELGFSRIVLAREMSAEDIKEISHSGIETEIFVHGALCVCHSGMCLMSSVIGNRSGNRGMCAQPCRLPYSFEGEKQAGYKLSPKDMSLSRDVEKLLSLGVTSLKIEGRMKSPEYVGGTVAVWRQLLDAGHSADNRQYTRLEQLFSRGGFTNSYFTKAYLADNKNMYGVRSDEDKKDSARLSKSGELETEQRKIMIQLDCRISEGKTAFVNARCRGTDASFESDFVCQSAISAPITENEVRTALNKLGGTVFEAESIGVELSGNVFMSKSQLNALRRGAVEALQDKLTRVSNVERAQTKPIECKRASTEKHSKLHLSFRNPADVLCCQYKSADFVSLPLEFFEASDKNILDSVTALGARLGVALPRVMFNGEYEAAYQLLTMAKQNGADFAVISSIGQIDLCAKLGFTLFSDVGMNVFNSCTKDVLTKQGFEFVTLSPELNPSQMRDIDRSGAETCVFVKGQMPLMVLESCIVRADGRCEYNNCKGCKLLRDRLGYKFPVYGQKRLLKTKDGKLTGYPCRNIIYNSVSTALVDKKQAISKISPDLMTVII